MRNLGEGQYFGESVKSAENELFKLSMTHYAPDECTGLHDHDNNYLSILTSGNYIEDSKSSSREVIAGEVLYRPGSYSHKNTFREQASSCFNLEFKHEWNKRIDFSLKLPEKFSHYQGGRFPSLYKALLDFKIGQPLDTVSEHVYDWLFEVSEKSLSLKKTWVEKVRQILSSEFGEFHSLNDLADRVCIHPIYLSRAFKASTGYTVSEFQINAKLANALSMLLNTSGSISTISHYNGFFDDAHFIRSFKGRYGASPFQFRKKLIS